MKTTIKRIVTCILALIILAGIFILYNKDNSLNQISKTISTTTIIKKYRFNQFDKEYEFITRMEAIKIIGLIVDYGTANKEPVPPFKTVKLKYKDRKIETNLNEETLIENFHRQNIMFGYPPNFDGESFRLDKLITLGEFSAILDRIDSKFLNIFFNNRDLYLRDIKTHWANKHVQRIINMGLLEGITKEFDPESNLTRVELLTIIENLTKVHHSIYINSDCIKTAFEVVYNWK